MVSEESKINRSIRANKEVFARIQDIAKEKGMDQGACLEALVNAWDIQNAKGLVPERAADIADFDDALQRIEKAFLRSLDLASSAESRARNSYAAQLDAMGGTVARLKAELAEAQKEAEDAKTALAEAMTENARLKVELANSGNIQAVLAAYAAKLDAQTPRAETPKRKRGAKPEPETPKAETIDFPKETAQA